MPVLTLESEVFRLYTVYGSAVILKMMAMSFATYYYRKTKDIHANREDAIVFAKGVPEEQVTLDDPDVERTRRCHRNDMENIPPFLFIGLFYVITKPSVSAAAWHFRIFTAARFLHAIAYLKPLPQPSRGLFWAAGFGTTVSMAICVLRAVL